MSDIPSSAYYEQTPMPPPVTMGEKVVLLGLAGLTVIGAAVAGVGYGQLSADQYQVESDHLTIVNPDNREHHPERIIHAQNDLNTATKQEPANRELEHVGEIIFVPSAILSGASGAVVRRRRQKRSR